MNDERGDLKLVALKENALLNKAAFLKATDMMEKDYFSHTSPQGITPWYWFKKVGYDYKSAGENLGIGFVDSKELHEAWNNSPSHKANLVNANYREVGISFLEGNFQGGITTIVVQMFGTPRVVPAIKPVVVVKPITQNNSVGQKPTQTTASNIITSNQATANLTNIFSTTGSSVAGDASSSLIVDATSGLIFVSTTTSDLLTQNQPSKPEITGIKAGILKFFAKDYNSLTQKIVLIFLVINLVALVLNIIIKIFVQHYDLILKASLISIALILLITIGPKEIIALIQPYAKIF